MGPHGLMVPTPTNGHSHCLLPQPQGRSRDESIGFQGHLCTRQPETGRHRAWAEAGLKHSKQVGSTC